MLNVWQRKKPNVWQQKKLNVWQQKKPDASNQPPGNGHVKSSKKRCHAKTVLAPRDAPARRARFLSRVLRLPCHAASRIKSTGDQPGTSLASPLWCGPAL